MCLPLLALPLTVVFQPEPEPEPKPEPAARHTLGRLLHFEVAGEGAVGLETGCAHPLAP